MSASTFPNGGHCGLVLARFGIAAVGLAMFTMCSLCSAIGVTNIEPFQPNVWPGGRAVAVTVSPNNSSVAVVASESGGLFQTVDGGNTWKHLSGLLPLRMADVKYSPVSSQGLIATAFADTRSGNRGGIWRSANGGTNWGKPATSNPPVGPKCPAAANAYGISYVSAGIFVGTDCGVRSAATAA
jgi:photosystem II stability/assembly factor-like uncharacterized protein